MNNVQTLPFWKKLMYALGQFGWSLASYSVANLITYFFMPPISNGIAIFPRFLFSGAVFLGLTIIGLINFGGRFFDAITDPIIAGMSDRSKSRFGKRRTFLAISGLPTALFAFLVFFPLIMGESSINIVWLIIVILVYYLAITMYVTPFNALISELGHNTKERLNISTIISITWALGFATGNMIYALQGGFEAQALGVSVNQSTAIVNIAQKTINEEISEEYFKEKDIQQVYKTIEAIYLKETISQLYTQPLEKVILEDEKQNKIPANNIQRIKNYIKIIKTVYESELQELIKICEAFKSLSDEDKKDLDNLLSEMEKNNAFTIPQEISNSVKDIIASLNNLKVLIESNIGFHFKESLSILPEDIQKIIDKPAPISLTKLKDTIKSIPASIPTIEQLQSADILQPLLSCLKDGSLNKEVISDSINELQKASARAFQFALAIFCLAAMIMMYLPVIFINEKKYCESHVSNEGIFTALKSAFSNRNFLKFTFSDLTYWLSLAFIQMGISYYVITLLNLPKESASLLMTILFVLSFVFYVPINLIAQKIGKKKVLILAFIVFALDFAMIFFLGKLPFSNELQGYLVVILASLPIAIFGILPNAIVADIADADGIEKGNYKAGMFFAARTFMMKLGQSIANLIFPSFLLLGQTITNDWGIRLTGAAAFSFCVIGLLLFLMYDEKKVMRILSTKEIQSTK